MSLGLVVAIALGLGLGVVTGIPLGVINVAIVDAATSGRVRFAAGLALGGAAADAIHAALAFAGVGRVLTAKPDLVRGMAIAAGLALAVYVVIAWRSRTSLTGKPRKPRRPDEPAPPGEHRASAPAAAAHAAVAAHGPPVDAATAGAAAAPPAAQATTAASPAAPERRAQRLRGLATGFALTLPNPAALGAWVAVAAALWPSATLVDAVVLGVSVGISSGAWFTLLGHWISGVRRDHPALAWVPRVALLVLVAIGVVGVARAL